MARGPPVEQVEQQVVDEQVEEQVAVEQAATQSKVDERRGLERQAETLDTDRNRQRAAQRRERRGRDRRARHGQPAAVHLAREPGARAAGERDGLPSDHNPRSTH